MRTTLSQEIQGSGDTETVLTDETPSSEADQGKEVKFLKPIRYRSNTLAIIYGKSKTYPGYRVAWSAVGRRISLFGAVSVFVEAAIKLGERPVNEAVEGFLRTVAVGKRKNISQAVEDFINAEESRTLSENGKRAQLSKKYAYNRRSFFGALPGLFLPPLFPICPRSTWTSFSPPCGRSQLNPRTTSGLSHE
jgi:hypothetical protein